MWRYSSVLHSLISFASAVVHNDSCRFTALLQPEWREGFRALKLNSTSVTVCILLKNSLGEHIWYTTYTVMILLRKYSRAYRHPGVSSFHVRWVPERASMLPQSIKKMRVLENVIKGLAGPGSETDSQKQAAKCMESAIQGQTIHLYCLWSDKFSCQSKGVDRRMQWCSQLVIVHNGASCSVIQPPSISGEKWEEWSVC